MFIVFTLTFTLIACEDAEPNTGNTGTGVVPPPTDTFCKTINSDYNYETLDYQFVWADEFDGNELNMSNWKHEIGGSGWGNNELQYYTDKSDNSYGDEDFWMVKINDSGTVIWDVSFGGDTTDILTNVQFGSNQIWLGGYSISDSSGNKTEDSYGGFDFWIVSIDDNGSLAVYREFDGKDEHMGNVFEEFKEKFRYPSTTRAAIAFKMAQKWMKKTVTKMHCNKAGDICVWSSTVRGLKETCEN